MEKHMLSATRPIVERCNRELLLNSEEEACVLENRYFNNKRKEIIDSVNLILNRKPKNSRKMIKMISEQEQYEHEFNMFLDLTYIKKIASSENSENTSFYHLSSVEEIYKKYKLIYLLLMRIALGTVSEVNDYLTDIMEAYYLEMEDLVFVAQVENINF